jgi:HlyD family secretion protein
MNRSNTLQNIYRSTVQTIKKRYKVIGLLFLSLLVLYLIVFRVLGGTSLREGKYRTSAVDKGYVYKAIETVGIVEPANEVIIISPGSSVIKKILKKTGSYVLTGEAILMLDTEPVESQIGKISDQLNVMENNLNKNRLNAKSVQVDLNYDLQVKKLRIASLKSDIENQQELLKVGGISPSKVEKNIQELELAEQDLKTTLEKNSIRLKQLDAEEEGILLQIDIQRKELTGNQELLRKMVVKAPSSGIILAIKGNEGEKINTDALLVRMSNLSVLKIRASIGIKQAGLIKTGGSVFVVNDDSKMSGMIGSINPVANDDKIEFDVFLDETEKSKLIPNQKVDIQVVTEQVFNALRIKTGNAIGKAKNQEVYVIQAGNAVKKEVEFGLVGIDYIEIRSGLKENDSVIISTITAFRHRDEIHIK